MSGEYRWRRLGLFLVFGIFIQNTFADDFRNNFSSKELCRPPLEALSVRGKIRSQNSVNAGVRHKVYKNDFLLTRSLREYVGEFHPSFPRDLQQLGKDDIILDVGAGRANAAVNYLTEDFMIPPGQRGGEHPSSWPGKYKLPPRDERATVIAVSKRRPRRDRSLDEDGLDAVMRERRLYYLSADVVNLPVLYPLLKGRVSLIEDVYGALKYSHFEKVLRAYLSLLKVGGKIHFSRTDAHILDPKTQEEILPSTYFHGIKGIRFKFVPNRQYTTALSRETNGKFVVEKISDNWDVPPLRFSFAEMVEGVGGSATYELQEKLPVSNRKSSRD